MFLQVDITSTFKLLVTSKVKSDMYFVQLFVLLVAFFLFSFLLVGLSNLGLNALVLRKVMANLITYHELPVLISFRC